MLQALYIDRRTTMLGLISWAVPLLISFLFFDRSGQLVVPQALFKSIMIVVFGGLGAALLVAAFRRHRPALRSGILIGCYWLFLNLALDLIILLPLTGMGLTDYVFDIGLRYLLIPVMGAAMGAAAEYSR